MEEMSGADESAGGSSCKSEWWARREWQRQAVASKQSQAHEWVRGGGQGVSGRGKQLRASRVKHVSG